MVRVRVIMPVCSAVLARPRVWPGPLSGEWKRLGSARVEFLEKRCRKGDESDREYRQRLANVRCDLRLNHGALAPDICVSMSCWSPPVRKVSEKYA